MLNYPVILIPDEETQSLVVEFPDLPFCHSAGDGEDEALLNARDAIESALKPAPPNRAVFVEHAQQFRSWNHASAIASH